MKRNKIENLTDTGSSSFNTAVRKLRVRIDMSDSFVYLGK